MSVSKRKGDIYVYAWVPLTCLGPSSTSAEESLSPRAVKVSGSGPVGSGSGDASGGLGEGLVEVLGGESAWGPDVARAVSLYTLLLWMPPHAPTPSTCHQHGVLQSVAGPCFLARCSLLPVQHDIRWGLQT